MLKKLSVGKILIAVLLVIASGLCAFMGVMAIKKSMTINMGAKIYPEIRCQIEFMPNNGTYFTKIFSNVEHNEYIAPNVSLDAQTSTLTLSQEFRGGIGAGFFLRVYNYSNERILVEALGEGVSYRNVAIQGNSVSTSYGDLIIASVTNNITIKFTKVYQVKATLVNTTFNLESAGNTLIKSGDYYYTPIGINLQTQFSLTDAVGSHINFSTFTIAGANATPSSYYSTLVVNEETIHTLNIPSSSITGDIVINGAKEYNTYTIQYNANGGSVDADSKVVTWGSAYGTLPTPTRTGFTFKGWGTKNLLNDADITAYNNGEWQEGNQGETINGYTTKYKFTKLGNNGCSIYYHTSYVSNNFGMVVFIDGLKKNTNYTLTTDYSGDLSLIDYFYVYKTYLWDSPNVISDETPLPKTFNTGSNSKICIGQYILARPQYNNLGKTLTITDLQLEEGKTATAYEPYHLYTASEVVSKTANHTLYAMWDRIEYTATLDNEDATTAGTESVASYYSCAMTKIAPPTKTGFTFGGYFTEVNGAGTQYYNADGTSAHIYDFAQNVTLYAKWT